MAGILVVLVIILPWLGAVFVWLAGDERPAAQHRFAVLFSVLTGLASLVLLLFSGAEPVSRISSLLQKPLKMGIPTSASDPTINTFLTKGMRVPSLPIRRRSRVPML